MGKKRSHDFSGTSLDVSQKKPKHSASSSNKSNHLQAPSSDLSRVNEHQKTTGHLAAELVPDTEGGAYDHPQQGSASIQDQAHNSEHLENPRHLNESIKDSNLAGLGRSLSFSTFRHSSSGLSSRKGPSSNPAKLSVNFSRYNGHPSTLPQLPAILDKALESVVFTHPGSLSCDTASKVNISYDRLEFLGDAYIELIATRVVFSRFPHLTAGRLSQQRELLVKNETLAEFALAYGFDGKAKLPKFYSTPGKDNRKLWLKALGDVFEAFVAAVIISDLDQGFQIAEAWLAALWETKLGSQTREDTEMVDAKAKMHLATKVMGKGIKVNYRDEAPPVEIRQEGKLIFQVGVYLTGWGWKDQHLGSGKGLSKLEAGQKAAALALVNPLTAQVASVKTKFDEQVSFMRNRQDQAEHGNEVGVSHHD